MSGLIYQWARPFPDGSRLLALANLPQQALRLYVQMIQSGKVTPLTGPLMVRNAAVSPNGGLVAILNPEERLLVFSTNTGDSKEIATAEPLAPIRWSRDGE